MTAKFDGPFKAIAAECVEAAKSGESLTYDAWVKRYPIIDRAAFVELRKYAETEALGSMGIIKPKPPQISSTTHDSLSSEQKQAFFDAGGIVFSDYVNPALSDTVTGHDGRRITADQYEAMSTQERSAFVMPRD